MLRFKASPSPTPEEDLLGSAKHHGWEEGRKKSSASTGFSLACGSLAWGSLCTPSSRQTFLLPGSFPRNLMEFFSAKGINSWESFPHPQKSTVAFFSMTVLQIVFLSALPWKRLSAIRKAPEKSCSYTSAPLGRKLSLLRSRGGWGDLLRR